MALASLTGMTRAHQIVQQSITEHIYAAILQHSWTGERFAKLTSLDWIDAMWLLICAMCIISPFVKRERSRMHCNADISSSISISSLVSKWDRVSNPVGSRKKVGENGSLVHWSSAKVVWSTIRVDPAKTDELRSCLSNIVRISCNIISFLALPKYGPFDSAGEIDALFLADLKQLLYGTHVKLNLGGHPKASLYKSRSAQSQSNYRGN